MLSVFRGHSVRYLTDEVAKAREGYYSGAVAAGEPAGLWWGNGAETLGLSGEVDADLMEAVYTHLRDPRDPLAHDAATRESAAALSSGHRKYKTADQIYAGVLEANPGAGPEERAQLRNQAARSARQAVSFIDVTFSAPKSVTVAGLAFERAANEARGRGDLEAAAAWDVRAQAVEDALMAGSRAALAYLQEHAGYSRVGHHGGGSGRWIDAHEFVVAQFLQHDSRERDPQWHVHAAILNRVLCSDGVWRGLDGKAIDEHKAAAGALAERVMEAYLAQSVGVRAQTRPDGIAREIVGVDRELMDLYSSRSRQIGPKAAALIREFETSVGRAPSSYERVVIHEQATLATRRAKSHDGETREEQFARWEAMAAERITGGLVPLAERLLEQAAGSPDEFSPLDVVERAVADVGTARQHYNRSDVFRAVSNALPGHLGIAPDEVLPLMDGLTDAAMERVQQLTPKQDTAAMPPELLLANGESVYARHGSTRYATPGQLAAERALIAAAVQRGAAQLDDRQVDAVTARFATSGMTLGADQEAALRGVLTSGAQVEVLTAAAGTGKSFVVGAIADSWTNPPPVTPDAQPDPDDPALSRRVFGLAPYQVAADVLAGEGLASKNIRAWLATQGRLDRARPGVPATGPNGDDEAWRLRRDDLVVIDEAGTAETGDLLAIYERCAAVGAKLLLVGDPRQLSAIGPGGALADLAEHGIAYQLTDVRRFKNGWEGSASLRLREGDASALAEYDRHGRILDGGTAEQAEAKATRAWLADTLDGREALLMVATNSAAARVAASLRDELVRLGRVQEEGVPLGMGDQLAEWRGVTAGVGDLVEGRALAWHLARFEDNVAAPVTRKAYRVLATRADGGLTVAPVEARRCHADADEAREGEWNDWGEQQGPPMQLPGSYVREHISLAYASTKDAAQGRTVDTAHTVNGAAVDSASLYVPLTRGREANTVYAITRHLAPDAETGETHDVAARDPLAVLTDLVEAIHDDYSAVTEQQIAESRAASVMTHLDRMVDLIREVNAGRVAATLDRLAATGALSPFDRQRLAADDAFGSLERLLRTAELAGHDADAVLEAAVTARSLDTAEAPAQVLHHRITTALTGRLTPHLRNGVDDLIPSHLRHAPSAADAALTPMTEKRADWLRQLADAADNRRHELGSQTAADSPAWAIDALGPVPDGDDPAQTVARQDWESRAGWAAAYRELVAYTDEQDALGAAPGRGRVEHAAMFRAAHEALNLSHSGEEEASLSDGALRARVAAWERERNWAPRWVDEELAATHEHRERRAQDATVWEAHADTPDTPPDDAARLRAEAAAARAEVVQLDAQLADLEMASNARALWAAHTMVTRDKAERSEFELRARGLDPRARADRTTAEEWLATYRDNQANDERDQRHVDEHDLAPEQADSHDRHADTAPVDITEDIRERSSPDPTEHTDSRTRRYVPPLQEMTKIVERAHATVDELTARRPVDDAPAAADAADRAAEEDARRADLIRWSTEPAAETAAANDDTAVALVRDR